MRMAVLEFSGQVFSKLYSSVIPCFRWRSYRWVKQWDAGGFSAEPGKDDDDDDERMLLVAERDYDDDEHDGFYEQHGFLNR